MNRQDEKINDSNFWRNVWLGLIFLELLVGNMWLGTISEALKDIARHLS